MSDFKLIDEEGFVEVEVEVRGDEFTLRVGQESYRRHISIIRVAQRREMSSRYRYSRQTLCVAFLKWGEQVVKLQLANKQWLSLGAGPNRTKRLTRGMDLLRGFRWKSRTGNQAVRLVNERTPVEPTKMRE